MFLYEVEYRSLKVYRKIGTELLATGKTNFSGFKYSHVYACARHLHV